VADYQQHLHWNWVLVYEVRLMGAIRIVGNWGCVL